MQTEQVGTIVDAPEVPPIHEESGPAALSILGIPVVFFDSYQHAVAHIGRRIRARRKTFCVAINPEKIDKARHDPKLRTMLQGADLGICDGVGIILAVMLCYGKRFHRCTGCDLFGKLVEYAASSELSVFLLGAAPEVNKAACEKLKQKFPGLRIAGARDGFFKDDAQVIDQINASGADLLFVAMGSPKQEFWITANRGRIDAPFVMGVGGSFDVHSGRVRRAPWLFRKTGTEFFYRLLCSPSRWKRQLALPRFAGAVLWERLSGRMSAVPSEA